MRSVGELYISGGHFRGSSTHDDVRKVVKLIEVGCLALPTGFGIDQDGESLRPDPTNREGSVT